MLRKESDSSMGAAFTKQELEEMWKRTPQEQYDVMVAKIIEAINLTDGKISISWSGGADSTFLLYVFCSVWKEIYPDKPVVVTFADTTNEHKWTYEFIREFPSYLEEKFGVKIELHTTRPADKQTYATVCREIGLPLVSKRVAESVNNIRRWLKEKNMTFADIEPYLEPTIENKDKLLEMGFGKTILTYLLGYDNNKQLFRCSSFKLASRWYPLIYAPFNVTHKCCKILKKKPMERMQKELGGYSPMIGEMASDGDQRQLSYLQTGCNNFVNGKGKSKPMGSMTQQGLLENMYKLQVPVSKCYGYIEYIDNKYRYSECQRTGCTLCGFGLQFEPDRFVRLYREEPAKVKFAFKPFEEGGLGYREAIEYLNKYCKCNIQIPDIKD